MDNVLKSPGEVEKCLSHVYHPLAIDTETTDLDLDSLSLLGISFADKNDAWYIDLYENPDREEILSIFRDFIHDNQEFYVMHNAVFDMKVLGKYGIRFDNSQMYDTMTGEHLLDENRSKSLKSIASDRLGVETEEFQEGAKEGYQSNRFYQYAINDARWTYDIADQQIQELEEEGLKKLMFKIEMPYVHCLYQMKKEGMIVDEEELERQRENGKNKLAYLNTKICHEANIGIKDRQTTLNGGVKVIPPINLDSTQQLGELLYEDLGLPVVEETPAGAPSVNSTALRKLEDEHPVIPLLQERKKVAKLLNGFLESIPEHIQDDGKVRPSFHNTGAKTGRLSCSEPNLQNQPKEAMEGMRVRNIFKAPEGYKMISVDYDGQENRVAACVCNDSTMKEIIRKGKDLHLVNADAVFDLGLSEEQVTKGSDVYAETKKKYKKERTKAKVFSYGILYGATHYRIQDEFNCSEQEAKNYIQKYFEKFQGIKNKKDKVKRFIKRHGYVESMFGRKRRFEEHPKYGYSDSAFRQGFNFTIQSPCADVIRAASVQVLNVSRNNPEWDLKQVATVHDENLYICKEEYAEEAADRICEEFENVVNLDLPLPADADIGDSYGEA